MTKTKNSRAKLPILTVTTWDLRRFRAYSRQLRKHDGAVERMMRSIEMYGFKVPLLVASNGDVIDGHLRLKAARKLGLKSLPVIVCDGWTDVQIRGFRLMVNRSAQWAEWDWDAVALELAELGAEDFELDLTGFDAGDIQPTSGTKTVQIEPEICPYCKREIR